MTETITLTPQELRRLLRAMRCTGMNESIQDFDDFQAATWFFMNEMHDEVFHLAEPLRDVVVSVFKDEYTEAQA